MDATLVIHRTPTHYAFDWLPQPSPLLPPAAAVGLTGTTAILPTIHQRLQTALDEAAQFLNLQSQPADSVTAIGRTLLPLSQLGQALFQQTLPPPIQAALVHLPNQANLTLATTDTSLPWELLHDGQDFLALRHQVGRVLPYEEAPHIPVITRQTRLKCLLLGNPTGNLPGTAHEIDRLHDLLSQHREWVECESYLRERVNTAQFLQWLASGQYDFIHFAGHARPGHLRLADDWLALPAIQRAVKGRPVIYLNACATARDLEESDRATQNLANTFLQRGATAVIGMLWPIPDQSSAELSYAFYQELLRGATIGAALRHSRAALRNHPAAGVAWLAPVLYGDPRLRPFSASLIERTGTVLQLRFPPGALGDVGQPVDVTGPTQQQQVRTLRSMVTSYGGVTVTLDSAGLTALFGVYRPLEQDALAAVRAAVDIRHQVATWGLPPAQIGIASGDLAVEPLTTPGERPEPASWTQPMVLGAPLVEAVHLAQSAASDQICLNERAVNAVRHRYQFAEGVYSKILLHEIINRPFEHPPRSSDHPAQSSQRAREWQRLQEEWATVLRGQRRVVGIAGEAGIGKTHLLKEFVHSLSPSTAHWLALNCAPHEQHTPYGLLVQLFRQLLAIPAGADKATALTQIQTGLAGATGILQQNPAERTILLLDLLGYPQATVLRPLVDLQPGQEAFYRSRLLDPLQFLIRHSGQQLPLVLVVEDAHWLDLASQQVLIQLTDSMRELPILFLFSYRTGWQHGWSGKPYYHYLPLDELDLPASRQLLEKQLGSTDLPNAILELPARLGGNPLFLLETVRSLIERQILQPEQARPGEAAGWQLHQPLTVLQLPDTVQRMLQLRLEQLADETRRVLEIAALIGPRFSPSLLARINDQSEIELWPQLDELRERGILEIDWTSGAYTFHHAAMQEAAVAKITPRARRVYHARIAQSWEQSAGPDSPPTEILAQHYYLSLISPESSTAAPHLLDNANPHLLEKALTYLLLSGERGLAHYGLQEAKASFQRAVAVAALLVGETESHDGLQAQAEAGLGNTYSILGEWPDALHHLRRAYACCHTQPLTAESRRLTADLARRIARLYTWRKEYEKAFAWIAAGLEKVAQQTSAANQAVAALLHIHAGSIYYNQGDYDTAARSYLTGVELAEAIQAKAVLAEGYHLLGAVARIRSQYAAALQHYSAALRISQELQDEYQIARVTGNMGVVYYEQADWTAARAHQQRARSFWQAIGDRNLEAHTSLNLGNIDLCLGDWVSARRYFEEALALWTGLDSGRWIALCHNNLGLLAIEQEQWAEARVQLTENQTATIVDIRLEALYALAEVDLAAGQVQPALAGAAEAVTLAQNLNSARELALALRIAGRTMAATGDVAKGRSHLQESATLLATIGARYELARTRFRLAELEAQVGNLVEAREFCQRALDTFQSLQAQKDWERTRRLQARLGDG